MPKKKAVFLDRDGVLNHSLGNRPPNTVEELVLLPGVPRAINLLNEAGFLTFVVTNQGGVALGYLTRAELSKIHAKLVAEIAIGGGYFTEIMACTHRPQANCPCRKPRPGMLFTLAKKYSVDLPASYMIGDRDVDIVAGKAAGTTTILISDQKNTSVKPDYVCTSLLEASQLILEKPAKKH